MLLSQIVARLPAGTDAAVAARRRPGVGPLTMHGVRFVQRVCPDVRASRCRSATVRRRARAFTANASSRSRRSARCSAGACGWMRSTVAGATLDLPEERRAVRAAALARGAAADRAAAGAAGRHDPRRRLPAHAGGRAADRHPHACAAASMRARASCTVERSSLDSDRGRFTAARRLRAGDDYRTDLTASARAAARRSDARRPRIGLVARGDLSRDGRRASPATCRRRCARSAACLRGKDDTALDAARVDADGARPGPADRQRRSRDDPLAFDAARRRRRRQRNAARRAAPGRRSRRRCCRRTSAWTNQVLDVQPLALRRVRRHGITCAATPTSRIRTTPASASRSTRAACRGAATHGTRSEPGGSRDARPRSSPMPTSASPARIEAWAAIGKATLLRDGAEGDGRTSTVAATTSA